MNAAELALLSPKLVGKTVEAVEFDDGDGGFSQNTTLRLRFIDGTALTVEASYFYDIVAAAPVPGPNPLALTGVGPFINGKRSPM